MAKRIDRGHTLPPSMAIICLHGSGASSAIFRLQLGRLRFALKTKFEFIFVNAPNPSVAGPGMLPLFAGAGPFYRWFELERNESEPEIARIHTVVRAAVESWESTKKNPNSRIVGMVAFSQGAIAATMLLWQQQQKQLPWLPVVHFAILICCDFAEELATYMDTDANRRGEKKAVLRLPTLHLHGRADPYLKKGKRMVQDHFDAETVEVVEFEGGHQCPNTRHDCEEVTQRILKLSDLALCKTSTGLF